MEAVTRTTFTALFPKYAGLLSSEKFFTNQNIQYFIKNELPSRVQMVKKLDSILDSFLNQYTNLIIKRPQVSNLAYSLSNKANELLEKTFKQLQLKLIKVDRQTLSRQFEMLNPRRSVQHFRNKMSDLQQLINQKYIQNRYLDRHRQQEISEALYTLFELYHFAKSDLVTISTKHYVTQSKICKKAFNNEPLEVSQFMDIIFLDNKFGQYIDSIVQKRCRPFHNKKQTFTIKLKQIRRQHETQIDKRIQTNIITFLQSTISRQKHRISKIIIPQVQNILKNTNENENKNEQEKECKDITLRVDSLKRKFMNIKNNSFYMDIVRGDFSQKYKIQLRKLENLYYLSNLEKYLQDVMEFVEELLAIQQDILLNRQRFKQNLNTIVQNQLAVLYQEDYNNKQQRLIQVISSKFSKLQQLLYTTDVVQGPQSMYHKEAQNRIANLYAEQNKRQQQIRIQKQERQRKLEEQRNRKMQQEAEQRLLREQERKKLEANRKLKEKQDEEKRRAKMMQEKQEREKREEENKRKEQQERRKRAEDMAKRQKQLEQKKKQEQQKKKIEQRQRRQAEQKKKSIQQEDRKKREAQKKKKEEEDRLKRQEEDRKRKQLQQKRKKEDEEKQRRQDEDRKKKEDETKRQKQIEDKRKKQEEENRRKQAEQRKKREDDERRKKQEEEKKKKEAQQKKKREEEDRKRSQQEKRKKDQQDRKKKQAEEKKRKQEQELRKKQEEEKKKRQQQERKKKQAEDKKKKQQEERKRKQDQDRKRKQDEDRKRKQDEEKKRKQKQEEQRKRKEEQDRKKKEAQEKKKKEEQQRKAEELRKKKQAEQKKKKEQEQQRKKEQEQNKKKAQEKRKREEQERKLKQSEEKKQKEAAQKKKEQEQKTKKGGKGEQKKSSGINYGDLDDQLIDEDEDIKKPTKGTNSGRQPHQPNKKQDDQYLQEYDDDFDDFSPDKEDNDGQEGEEQSVIQLINFDDLKCLNDYTKGTSYARKNKPNLESFNNKTQYVYLFEEFIQAGKFFIYNDVGIAKAICDFAKELEDENVPETELQMTLETIKQAIDEENQKGVGSAELNPQTRLIFPLSFNNDLNVYLVEINLSENYIIIVFKQEPNNTEEYSIKLNNFLQAFRHIYNSEEELQLIPVVVSAETKSVLDTFDKQLPNLLLLFAIHYEQDHDFSTPIIINQYTIQRFFYISHVLQPFYEAVQNDEPDLINFYNNLSKKYEESDKLKILFFEADISNGEQYQSKVRQASIAFKQSFLKDKKAKHYFVMIQLNSSSEEEQQQFKKIVIYFNMSKQDAGKPTLTYYVVSVDHQNEQVCYQVLQMVRNELDESFETVIYRDFTRHNGLTQYSEWTLGLWAHIVEKRKMTPSQAFRTMTLSMTPYYVAYKQMD